MQPPTARRALPPILRDLAARQAVVRVRVTFNRQVLIGTFSLDGPNRFDFTVRSTGTVYDVNLSNLRSIEHRDGTILWGSNP